MATTSGWIGGIYTAPLIKRGTSWKIQGHLKGHKKSINVWRFNPSLKKEECKSGESTILSCTTYLATSGGDSTVSIWRAGDKNPFFIIKRAFLAGVNDLAWGLEGNVLFACSNDGEVMICHFTPGSLGDFITEKEKQQIILQNYGEIIYNEYKKNSKINIIREPTIALGIDSSSTEQKQITIEGKNAKKRIIPIAEKTFSSEVDPHNFKFIFKEFNKNANSSENKSKIVNEETKVMNKDMDMTDDLIVVTKRLNEEIKGEKQSLDNFAKQRNDQFNLIEDQVEQILLRNEEKFIAEQENK